MKDITLKIIGKQINSENEEDQVEFVTDGKAYLKNDTIYVLYEESEVSGFIGCKTTLKLKDNSLRMKRIGEIGFGTELFFKEGERFQNSYDTPYGKMDIEVLTSKVNSTIDKESLTGKIDVLYKISLDGKNEGINKLSIDVM